MRADHQINPGWDLGQIARRFNSYLQSSSIALAFDAAFALASAAALVFALVFVRGSALALAFRYAFRTTDGSGLHEQQRTD